MKQRKAKPNEVQKPLSKLAAMWERARQLDERKQYWYELQVQGWIKAESRKQAKQKLEDYFSSVLGVEVPFSNSSFGGGTGPGVSLEIEDARAETTHTQVRILWFKPYDYSRP